MASNPPVPPTPPPAPVPPPAAPRVGTSANTEIRIISHSNMFYWWPVWAIGLIMALLTLFSTQRMVIVPSDSIAYRQRKVETPDPSGEVKHIQRDAIIVPEGKNLLPETTDANGQLIAPDQPKLRMAATSNYGVVWATVLLVVIVITNVHLRGLWSVIVIVLILLVAVIFSLLDWWTPILATLSVLDIRINLGGYLFISLILLGIWLFALFFFDRQTYMIFTPGQVKVCLEIGGGETAFDSMGLVIQKQRDDLFRHWILGLGSGDLIIRTSGATAQEIHLPNVLFVGHKLQLIEEMQRERPVVKG